MAILVKICGITRPADAEAAIAAGADYLGVILRPSPRQVGWEEARRVVAVARRGPRAVHTVAVLSHPGTEDMSQAAAAGFDAVQLHGEETPAHAAALREAYPTLEIWKAIPARRDTDLAGVPDYHVDAYLLESGAGGEGGTGQRSPISEGALRRFSAERPCILAGGLDAHNVAALIEAVRPRGVDVSSGVESEPGSKDPEKLRAFVAAARGAAQRVTRS